MPLTTYAGRVAHVWDCRGGERVELALEALFRRGHSRVAEVEPAAGAALRSPCARMYGKSSPYEVSGTTFV